MLVTENAVDFRKLVTLEELHPGLIILPSVARDVSLALIKAAICYLSALGNPSDVMVNHVLEVSAAGDFLISALPPP